MKSRNYLTDKNKEDILIFHEGGLSSREICEQLNITEDNIYRFLKKNGLKSNGRKGILDEEDLLLIKRLYLNGMTIKQIHEGYFKEKCSSGAINKYLRKEGITRLACKVVTINHNYFNEIDNEHKAYWVGFLLADGWVKHHEEKGECYTVNISLKEYDGYILETLIDDLESNKTVKYRYRNTDSKTWDGKYLNKPHNMAYVGFNSKQLFDDLNQYGIIPNKTLKIDKLPSIDKSLMKHLIRGYFDGDGSVFINSKYNTPRVSFYGTFNFIKCISEFLLIDIELTLKTITTQKTSNVSFTTYGSKKEVCELYHYFYDDATIYLKRKKEVFEKSKYDYEQII